MTIGIIDLEKIKNDVNKDKYSVLSVREKIVSKLEKEVKKLDMLSSMTLEEIQSKQHQNKLKKKHQSLRMTLIKTNPNGRYIPLRYGTLLVCGALIDPKECDKKNILDTIIAINQGDFDKQIEKFLKEDPKFKEMKARMEDKKKKN